MAARAGREGNWAQSFREKEKKAMKKYLPLLVALLGVAWGVSRVPVQADDLCDIYLGTTAPEVWCTDNPTIVSHTTPCYPVEPPDAVPDGCPPGTTAFRVVYETGSVGDPLRCNEIPMVIYSVRTHYECYGSTEPSPEPEVSGVGYVTIRGSSWTSMLIAKIYDGNEWVDPHYMTPESVDPPGPWFTQYIVQAPGVVQLGLFERGVDHGQGQCPVWTTEETVVAGESKVIVAKEPQLPDNRP